MLTYPPQAPNIGHGNKQKKNPPTLLQIGRKVALFYECLIVARIWSVKLTVGNKWPWSKNFPHATSSKKWPLDLAPLDCLGSESFVTLNILFTIDTSIPHPHTNIHSLRKNQQFLGLPPSIIFGPAGFSGPLKWSWLLFNEEVSSLDKEFTKSLSDVAKLFSRALRLFASEGTGEWACTAHITDRAPSSAADELLIMSIQDCLPLDNEEDKVLDVFLEVSVEDKERAVPLSLGEDEDACWAACFSQIKPKENKINHEYVSILYFSFSMKLPQCFKKWPMIAESKGKHMVWTSVRQALGCHFPKPLCTTSRSLL